MHGKQIFNAFFSYSHLDAKATPRLIEPLAVELENLVSARFVNAGLAVWRDATHLRTGHRWNAEIENRLHSSDILIVLFSPSWIGSDYCRKEYLIFEEVEKTYGGGEFVVPILVRSVDDQVQHLNADQNEIYERLRERQFYPKLAVGGRGRGAALEEVAGHIVQILEQRRGAPPAEPAPPRASGVTDPPPAPAFDIDAIADAIAKKISVDKGVPLPVLQDILGRLGDGGAPLDAAAIEQRLRAKADEYAALQERLNRLSNDDPRVQALRQEAARHIAESDYAAADAALSQAEARDLSVVEELESVAKQRRISAAESRAERAAAARLQLDYRAAAGHYAEAAVILPPEEAQLRWRYARAQAGALYAAGEEFGDNAALREAVVVHRASLSLVPRGDLPIEWAMTQNHLGNALKVLGERESGTVRLAEAVVAFRAALEEMTRERVPLDWAMTQNNLGNALERLGERESGTARLEEAVSAYRAALEKRTRERVPLDWAAAQNNLGLTLSTLGEREGSTARLEEAVSAFRAALEEMTRERVPLRWAYSQHGLANTLAELAQREASAAYLEEALVHMRGAVAAYQQVGDDYWGPIARGRLAAIEVELLALKKAAKSG